GRADIILEHEEIALAGADQVYTGNMGVDVVRRLDAEHLGPERGVEQNELRRHEARLNDLLVVIDVVEEDVDRLDSLDAAPLHEIPLGAVEDAGDQVKRDQPLGRAAFGVDCKGDAEPAEQLLSCVLLRDEGIDRQIVEKAGKLGVGVPDRPVGRPHLVEESVKRRKTLQPSPRPLSSQHSAPSRPSWLAKMTL